MEKRIRTAIIVLAVLLSLSVLGLVARLTYLGFFAGNRSTVIVPDNVIGETDSISDNTDSADDNSTAPAKSDSGSSRPESISSDPSSNPDDSNNNNSAGSESSAYVLKTPSESESIGDKKDDNDDDKPLESPTAEVISSKKKDSSDYTVDEVIVDDFYEVTDLKKEAALIELYKKNPGDNKRFYETNIFPGDSFVKYYCVKVYHDGDIDLNFRVDIVGQSRNLGNALNIDVSRVNGSGLRYFSSSFNDVNGRVYKETLPGNSKNETIAYYRIVVTLPTYVGNEYQAASLTADFNWYVIDDRQDDVVLDDPIEVGDISLEADAANLLPKPVRMDIACVVLCVVSIVSVIMGLLLVAASRRCREHEE